MSKRKKVTCKRDQRMIPNLSKNSRSPVPPLLSPRPPLQLPPSVYERAAKEQKAFIR
ncbi:hypothetical protein GCM10022631_07210 [Deinococcus rubellus]